MPRSSRPLAIAVLLLAHSVAGAQQPARIDTTSRSAPLDSVRQREGRTRNAADSLQPGPARHSPSLAMGLSALLPGAGQVYNRSFWKVPVIAGLGGYFVNEFFKNNRTYKDYRDQYQQSLVANPAGSTLLLNLREFYKDQRDSFGWYFFILYVINIADAYVDASLFEFDVSSTLAVRLAPGAGTSSVPGPRLSVHLCF
jgi:hypothetical protein